MAHLQVPSVASRIRNATENPIGNGALWADVPLFRGRFPFEDIDPSNLLFGAFSPTRRIDSPPAGHDADRPKVTNLDFGIHNFVGFKHIDLAGMQELLRNLPNIKPTQRTSVKVFNSHWQNKPDFISTPVIRPMTIVNITNGFLQRTELKRFPFGVVSNAKIMD